jgi:hypothetical protein
MVRQQSQPISPSLTLTRNTESVRQVEKMMVFAMFSSHEDQTPGINGGAHMGTDWGKNHPVPAPSLGDFNVIRESGAYIVIESAEVVKIQQMIATIVQQSQHLATR